MSENWKTLNFNQLIDPSWLEDITAGSQKLLGYLTAARAALEQAKLAQKVLTATVPDVLAIAIKAIADVVEGLLQVGKVHALYIPVSKIFSEEPETYLPTSLDGLQEAYEVSFPELGVVLTEGAETAFAEFTQRTGGTKTFYRVFASSLMDAFDHNRPQYLASNDYVVMSVLLVGAPSFVEIVEAAAALNRLFRPSGDDDLTARMIPIPQNLTVQVIGAPGANRVAVRLEWDRPPTIFASPYIPRVGIYVNRYAIIRSTNPYILGARSVLDLFPTRNLTVGLSRAGHTVIAVGTGINSSYVDSDSKLDADTTYYYAVAWEVTVSEAGVDKTMAFDQLSSVLKTQVRTIGRSQKGVPPNWWAYKSALDLFPNFAAAMRRFVEELRVLGDRVNGVAALLSQGLDFATENFDQLVRRIADLNEDLLRLATILTQQLPGLYSTTMHGKGGNAYLLAELAARLNDTQDPDRPPYDENQYVAGVCLVGGGPRLPEVQPLIDMFESLFGDSSASNPLVGILSSLDGVIAAEEAVVFGPDMRPLVGATGTTIDPLTGLPPTGTPASTEIDILTGQPVSTAHVIAEDGTVVTGTDPKNPEIGVTGLLDLADLC